MKILEVKTDNCKYPIRIGADIVRSLSTITKKFVGQKVIIVDKNVLSLWKDKIDEIRKSIDASVIEVEASEHNKSIEVATSIWSELISLGVDRKSIVINIGGGMISDLGGFVASTYMRGIKFTNCPTTLLSMVDASVGGKVGVNFGGLKNIIGSFNQPTEVVIDLEFLKTLPIREYASGMAEVIKHGVINDIDYLKNLENKSIALEEIVLRSCEIKKKIVEADPNENDQRKILNFGHTIGHALEEISIELHNDLLHGEAVALGMIAEAEISKLMGLIDESDVELIINLVSNNNLPTKLTFEVDFEKLVGLIHKDKKNSAKNINWTLLDRLGNAIYDQLVPIELVQKAFNKLV
jgi:3-dehydroquinate synthase